MPATPAQHTLRSDHYKYVKLTQSVLVNARMLKRGLQLDDGGFQPLCTASVHQLPVDHRRLSIDSPVQMDHGDPLLVGPDHPGLDDLL